MDSVSALVIAIAVFTTAVMVFGNRSNTIGYIAGVVVAYSLAMIMTGGDMTVVYKDLIWNGDFNEYWRLFTCIWVPLNPVSLVINLVCFYFVGIVVEKRINNYTFEAIAILGAIFGLIQWSSFNKGELLGTSLAVAGIMGAALVLFTRLRIVVPKIGDTRLEVWNVCILWLGLIIVISYLYGGVNNLIPSVAAHIVVMAFGAMFALVMDSDRVKTVFMSLRVEKHVDIKPLEELCVTDSQTHIYDQMKELDDPFLVDLWAEAFVKKLSCPKCGKKYSVINSRVVCQSGHFLR